jgi:histone acetyltransferase
VLVQNNSDPYTDFSTMEGKLENNEYATVDDFVADAQLIFDNCRLYNPEGTVYVKNATKMEKFVKDQVATKLRRDN